MGITESKLPKMEEDSSANNTNATTNRPSQRRLTEPDVPIAADDPWWWEVENENLILDQVPNVTADNSESENVLSHDFNTLLKIGENVNLALISNSNNHNGNISTTQSSRELVKTISKSEIECDKTDYSSATDKADTNNSALEAHIALESSLSAREQSLEEFKEELRVKRLTRQSAVQDLRDEITTLRQQLAAEQNLTKRLRNGEGDATTAESMATDEPCQPLESVDGACAIAIVDADDADAMSRGRHANIELANAQLALQMANSENISLRTEVGVVQKQVVTLKEVIACCKQMITLKEEQCTQLKTKLNEIETSFGEREMKIMSDNLRAEYERQLGNIRQLRQLYEERQRISAAEHENLQRLMSIKKDELLAEQEKIKNFEERNQTLLKEVETANNELAALREECNEHKFEKKALKEEMGAVNTLFSQMVMGFNGKNNLDIDRLTTMLEENRTLLNDITTKEASCSDGATLPKLLFELVEQAAVGSRKASRSPTPTTFADEVEEDDNEEEQVNGDEVKDAVENTTNNSNSNNNGAATLQTTDGDVVDEGAQNTKAEVDNVTTTDATTTSTITSKNAKKHLRKSAAKMSSCSSSSTQEASASASSILKFHEREVIGKVTSAQEIIGNLPKVWKVLMELLSHHKIEQVQFEENGASEDCYKSVETPNGPKAELSVSKTYIKLKDLILEKKSLVKETNRLKTLNCHLDYRLNEQEKRLSAVSLELTKTWHLVGKMQRQHRQLHTQEQILRYQLQQKRRLLTELKDELEYCRRKWAAARAKNDESQEQYNDLRREFARRKLEDANNSAESGYSDSGPASDEEERAAAAVVGVANASVVGIDDAISVVDAVVVLPGSSSSSSNCRTKHLQERFEHTRKIKRMQSTSPGRAAAAANDGVEIVLRWNSAPPTCGWRGGGGVDDDEDDDEYDDGEEMSNVADGTSTNTGAVPKKGMRTSRSKDRGKRLLGGEDGVASSSSGALYDSEKTSGQRVERASRIHKLEQQCKSLIQQVLETSDNRERLEVQLCQFQDEIAPVQYAVPLDEFINKKRIERMTRASSAPATGSLTPREEEYTRKRSERLERLEEESRQLMSRIKRTSDRGHYLRCSLDRIRRAPSREGSFESNTEEEVTKVEESTIKEATAGEVAAEAETAAATTENVENVRVEESVTNTADNTSTNKSSLTEEEESYTARRAARLQRLEEESKQLLTKLTRNNQRGSSIGNRLDALHERFGGDDKSPTAVAAPTESEVTVDQIPATFEQRIQNIELISLNREERLRILEEEGAQLLSRLTNTSERGTQMINRITVREKNRQERSSSNTPPGEENAEAASTSTVKDVSPIADDTPIAAASTLLPTPKNVVCTSIVGEELTERVTVTTTPSQIAAKTGAIPKSKPLAQLCAGRPKVTKESTQTQRKPTDGDSETLEEMVKRLSALPFPAEQTTPIQDPAVEPQQDQNNLEPKE